MYGLVVEIMLRNRAVFPDIERNSFPASYVGWSLSVRHASMQHPNHETYVQQMRVKSPLHELVVKKH